MLSSLRTARPAGRMRCFFVGLLLIVMKTFSHPVSRRTLQESAGAALAALRAQWQNRIMLMKTFPSP
ncbi:hypothetical protein [Methylorubrum zatmanii]